MRPQAQTVESGTCIGAPDDWAAIVLQQLQERGGDLSRLTQLGSHYFTRLVIACRQPSLKEYKCLLTLHFFQVKTPGGKKIPQSTAHLTPNLRHVEEIDELLERATVHRSQSALKDLARFNYLTDYPLG
jgi:hypothetical protein